MVRILDNAASHVKRLMDIELVPFETSKVRWHLGFMGYRNRIAGFNLRPVFPCLDLHLQTLRTLVSNDGLGLPVPFSQQPLFTRHVTPLDDLTYDDRCKNLRRTTRRVKTGDFLKPGN
eukprot:Skav223559  [mRNA]  locus=scaffold2197:50380:50733:- [translate_table: standard]